MKKYRLKITRQDLDELRLLVLRDMPNEAGAFALAGVYETDEQVDVLVRRPVAIPGNLLPVQNEYHLKMAPQAINGLASLCEVNRLGAVICHSHPGGLSYSPSDDYGEGRITATLRQFLPITAPLASLLFTPDAITGRIWLPNENLPIRFDEIVVVGHFVEKIDLTAKKTQQRSSELYDRQIRAFGLSGQSLIENAKVGIVGVGGTGSPVAEQLARLGVKDMVLIDPDDFSISNLTRVYGTYYGSCRKSQPSGEKKVNLVAANLRKINPGARITPVSQTVVLRSAASKLLDRDIIFLCTDEHWGRSVVNQIAYQYFIPTINLGVRIASENGRISHAVGNLDVLRPEKPCLWCKQFLRSEKIAAESMPVEYRKNLQEQGYVEDIDTKTPSVISFTTQIASQAVSLFIHYFTNYMGDAGNISRLGYDFLTNSLSRGTTPINKECICQKVKGFGDLKPIPTHEYIDQSS